MSAAEGIVEYAKRVNRTWIVRGDLAKNAALYLQHLEVSRPDILTEVCSHAVNAAKQASRLGKDPKPPFYAGLFSQATAEERKKFLKDHQWTRRLAANFQPACVLPAAPSSEE